MEPLQFTITDPLHSNRRVEERRHTSVFEEVRSTRAGKIVALLAAVALLSAGAWKWRYVVHGPVWLARAVWADHSDLYAGKTNGIPNKEVVWQARNYLSQLKEIDTGGNLMAPEALRAAGVHLQVSWFKKHAPDVVDYNPFVSAAAGNFVVAWLYVPGCQKAVWKSSRTDADWYDAQGQPCYGVCKVSVFMDPHLKLTALKLDPLQYLQ